MNQHSADPSTPCDNSHKKKIHNCPLNSPTLCLPHESSCRAETEWCTSKIDIYAFMENVSNYEEINTYLIV